MATITPRKNRQGEIISYTIRVYRGYNAQGERFKPYTMTYKPPKGMTAKQIEKEVNRQAVQFEEECKRGGVADPTIRLSDFCEKYLEITKNTLSPTTYEFYKEQITDFIVPALGHLKLKDITAAHVQQYIQQLSTMPKITRAGTQIDGEYISPSTVRRRLAILQAVLKQAVKLGLIPETPARAEKLTLPKIKQPKTEIFSKQEAAQMLACLEQEDIQFQTLIQLAIFTGARRGELVALKFSDVDFEQSKITIERAAVKIKEQKTVIKPPKDYEVRTVTINQSCLELIKLLRAEKLRQAANLGTQWREEGWLFTTWNGEIMNPQTPTKQFSKFLERNGLRHRKFHSLRHTSATLLLYAGVNIKQVQGRLGHGDIETTNKYLHLIEEADVEAVNKLDVMLLPKSEQGKAQNIS